MNHKISMPGTDHLNQIGELVAVLVALQNAPPLTPIKIMTDSKYVITSITTHLVSWEDQVWIDISNAQLFKAIAKVAGNEEADQLAQRGVQKIVADDIDTYMPRNFDLQGAKLRTISQKTAYKAIMREKCVDTKRATLALLDVGNVMDVTRYTLETVTSTIETDKAIWQSFQMFLYKMLNNMFKISDFWTQIPTFEHRAQCQSCREDTESMEHILTQCNHPTKKQIWSLAKSLWPTKHGPWPEPTIGLILGCGALSLPQLPRDQNPDGASRLLKILTSESAHLIWVLRCKRTIKEQTHMDNDIVKRWTNAINRHLQLDRVIACKLKRTPKATTRVHNTWADVIDIDRNTQTRKDDWVTRGFSIQSPTLLPDAECA
ncbi:hypothetical protein BDR03DRAFT_1077719 [Suillus americanus]|nr:hypothetical protein BDR03DRAFT_1077719 [Suillus americanus]